MGILAMMKNWPTMAGSTTQLVVRRTVNADYAGSSPALPVSIESDNEDKMSDETDFLKRKIARLEAEITRLLAVESAAKTWHKLSLAEAGKYSGPEVLRARDRFIAVYNQRSIKDDESCQTTVDKK